MMLAAKTKNQDEKDAVLILESALRSPLIQILDNAGKDRDKVILEFCNYYHPIIKSFVKKYNWSNVSEEDLKELFNYAFGCTVCTDFKTIIIASNSDGKIIGICTLNVALTLVLTGVVP